MTNLPDNVSERDIDDQFGPEVEEPWERADRMAEEQFDKERDDE